ncbi:oxalurate catabolism protein HpxZ [Sulfuriferula thiophila]|uniref:oxalurate catabolism protein HpxZ n=1 Tax=Sulfuriferula thiophila TaxID=1781211 RepID=UPI000F6055A4|nr:oxalurate catabolism protein HpxZ [Sulfuriferula thiophila]
MIQLEQINLDNVVAELATLFASYEAALMQNDLATLDKLFWQNQLTVRYGTTENLYGIEAIRAFRQARNTGTLQRVLRHAQITTFGADCATTTTEFVREDGMSGRQSQTWVRFPEGWRVVSAHISLNEHDSAFSASGISK